MRPATPESSIRRSQAPEGISGLVPEVHSEVVRPQHNGQDASPECEVEESDREEPSPDPHHSRASLRLNFDLLRLFVFHRVSGRVEIGGNVRNILLLAGVCSDVRAGGPFNRVLSD